MYTDYGVPSRRVNCIVIDFLFCSINLHHPRAAEASFSNLVLYFMGWSFDYTELRLFNHPYHQEAPKLFPPLGPIKMGTQTYCSLILKILMSGTSYRNLCFSLCYCIEILSSPRLLLILFPRTKSSFDGVYL